MAQVIPKAFRMDIFIQNRSMGREQSSKAARIARPLDPLAYVAGYGSRRNPSEYLPNTGYTNEQKNYIFEVFIFGVFQSLLSSHPTSLFSTVYRHVYGPPEFVCTIRLRETGTYLRGWFLIRQGFVCAVCKGAIRADSESDERLPH